MKHILIVLVVLFGQGALTASVTIALPDPATMTIDNVCELMRDPCRSEEAVALLESPAHQERLKPLINTEDRSSYTALMYACENVNPVACLKLLELREALQLDVNKENRQNYTALIYACKNINPVACLKLLELRELLQYRQRDIDIAFMYACQNRNPAAFLRLLELDIIDLRSCMYPALTSSCRNKNPIACLKILELIPLASAYQAAIKEHACFMVQLYAVAQLNEIKTDGILISDLIVTIFHYLFRYYTIFDIKRLLNNKKIKLAFVFDALQPPKFKHPAGTTEEEAVKYKEQKCPDMFTFERYSQEEQELHRAYDAWIKDNNYECLSNYFVYMPHRMNHYATAEGIVENLLTEEQTKVMHSLQENLKRREAAFEDRKNSATKQELEEVQRALRDFEEKLEQSVHLRKHAEHRMVCRAMQMDKRYNDMDMKLYEDKNILFGLLDIGKTFFKSIDHLVMVLNVLAFVEKNQDKRAILYNRLATIYAAYNVLDLNPKEQQLADQRLDDNDFNCDRRSFLRYKKRQGYGEVHGKFNSLDVFDRYIEYNILMHNKEVVKRLLSNPKSVPNIDRVYLFLREHMDERIDDPILDKAWWESIHEALPKGTSVFDARINCFAHILALLRGNLNEEELKQIKNF